MQRLLILLICIICISAIFCIDHETFKNCSRVPFCSTMRRQEPNKSFYFSADIRGYSIKAGVGTIPLSNLKGDKLDLQISFLTEGKIRIKLLERNHSRYELTDILAEEFPPLDTTGEIAITGETILFSIPNYNATVQVKKAAPFSVKVLYNNQVEVVLRGDRIVINNNDTSQAFSFDVEFPGAKTLYGLHHHAYQLALGETADESADPFHLRNSDAGGYETGSTMALYGTVPVIYGHSPEHTSGIFLHNAAEQWVDISYNGSNPLAYFMVESGSFDLFVMVGPTPKEVVRQFTDLTGKAHLPQLWTLGYHQSRYSYMTQEDVKYVVANMDQHDFPMDAIWLDIDYTDEKKYFTWNPINFSHPEEMQRNLSSTNRKLVTIIDPHFKVDQDYPVYSGAKDDLFVKWANGSNFEDICWPGQSSWFDFLNPKARDYYANWYSYDNFKGSTEVLAGIWNDMNEPAVFNTTYQNTVPFELRHFGDVLHRDVHNIYGFLQSMATHQGLMQRDNGTKRPFILTRSHFAGSQRYAAMWTGDNTADWAYLAISYPECVNSNLVGMVFCGADVGGFFGNPSEELLQRWYQAGIWLPFFRGHSTTDSNRREPYLFSDQVQTVIRNAMKLRYKHIPVWYTLFYEHTRYGDPIIRPFFYDYPDFSERDDHVLIGSDILARPVLEPGVTSVKVTFPGSNTKWYRVDDDSWSVHEGNSTKNVEVDISTSPYYYRAGSIVPGRNREYKSTTDMRDDPLILYVNLDEKNNAQGTYYQDDYESFKYSTDNIYLYVKFQYVSTTPGIKVTVVDGDSQGLQVVLQQIIIHSSTKDSHTGSETIYTTAADGTPLQDIDIGGTSNRSRNILSLRENELKAFGLKEYWFEVWNYLNETLSLYI